MWIIVMYCLLCVVVIKKILIFVTKQKKDKMQKQQVNKSEGGSLAATVVRAWLHALFFPKQLACLQRNLSLHL